MSQFRTFIAGLILIISNSSADAQFGFEYDPNIPVINAGDTMDLAWSGGLSFPIFSDFDYDFDGDLDLFVFDRSSNNIAVFVQENNGSPYYRYEYNARLSFPSDLKYMAMLVDYDNDGRKDLFTSNLGGLKVYRNVGNAVDGVQWELFKELLYSQYPTLYTNLNTTSNTDIPAIIDVDLDGDIDILTFNTGGGRYVEYHQNQSMDIYGIPDSLEFVQMNECWGKFSEDPALNTILLNDPNPPCVGGNITNPEVQENNISRQSALHSGSSLLALDYNNSGVLDLIIGDAAYSSLSLLINGGTAVNTDSPMISVDYNFPSNTTPVDLFLFPASFYVDVDFDGVKDLIVAPSVRSASRNRKSVLFYKNLGSNTNPNFVFVKDDFLQELMIEHGKGTVPVLFDYDEDGLNDLIIANFYRYKTPGDKESLIAYYRNVGTNADPSFQFVDHDIFNLQAETYGLRAIPTFGDIDDDGDEDMFIGLEDGTIAFYRNNSVGGGSDFILEILSYPNAFGDAISTGGYCHPQLFDLNDDGLLDLLLGTKSGVIQYYQNTGDVNNPLFELMNPNLGDVAVNTTSPDGYAAPNFFYHNGDIKLFVGSIDGVIGYYDSIENNLSIGNTFNLVSQSYLDIKVGAYSSCWVEDLDNDTLLNMFVGQDLGGLYHFEIDTTSNVGIIELEEKPNLKIFPNPATDQLTIDLLDAIGEKITITDMKGRIVISQPFIDNTTVSLEQIENGVYFVQVMTQEGSMVISKMIKQ